MTVVERLADLLDGVLTEDLVDARRDEVGDDWVIADLKASLREALELTEELLREEES